MNDQEYIENKENFTSVLNNLKYRAKFDKLP